MTRLVWLGVALLCLLAKPVTNGSARDLPERISDLEFWRLTTELSEQEAGSYSSDNLVSNEILFLQVLPILAERTKPGGVYVGVGPEQNFTFIAAVKPRVAVIVDIRRVNWHLQLMYKAVFELSTDRVDFLSRLFARRRPTGLVLEASAAELMEAFSSAAALDDQGVAANLQSINDRLTKTHNWPLSPEDQNGIARVYRAFHRYGVQMNSASNLALTPEGVGRSGPTYRDLMVQTDSHGEGLSYLGSEQRFTTVKDLQSRNLVLPIVGDFAGTKALRALGEYLKNQGASLSVFYLSNVENYLRRDRSWEAFCANVAAMPLSPTSQFIRVGTTSFTYYPNGVALPISASGAAVVPIAGEVVNCRSSLILATPR